MRWLLCVCIHSGRQPIVAHATTSSCPIVLSPPREVCRRCNLRLNADSVDNNSSFPCHASDSAL